MPKRTHKNHHADSARTREAEDALRALSVLGVLTPQDRASAQRSARSFVSGTAAVKLNRRTGDLLTPEEIRTPVQSLEAQQREAAMVISAMEAASESKLTHLSPMERRVRRISRANMRARAELKLWADGLEGEPWRIYTRDLDGRAMGFVCQDRLPLGYGGWITFTLPDGRRQSLEVTVTRCRPCSSGWYEGALHFNHSQGRLVDMIRQCEQLLSGEAS